MTFWYDADSNALVENKGDYLDVTSTVGFQLHVDEMPPDKLENIRSAVETAIEANGDGAEQ